MTDLSIVNTVGGGSISQNLNLLEVYRDFPQSDVQYEPETFPAVVIQYEEPKGTVMLYASGKYSLAGAQSASEAREVSDIFIHQLENVLGQSLVGENFEVRYLVGTADLGIELNLNQVAVALGMNRAEYEPEQFPGLLYRQPGKSWFCLIFSSGKVVISGVEDEQEMQEVYDETEEELSELVEI